MIRFPKQSRDQNRNKQPGVLEPKPKDVFIAMAPTRVPANECARADCAAMRGPEQLWNSNDRSDYEKSEPLAPLLNIDKCEHTAHTHGRDEAVRMDQRQQTRDEAGSDHAAKRPGAKSKGQRVRICGLRTFQR